MRTLTEIAVVQKATTSSCTEILKIPQPAPSRPDPLEYGVLLGLENSQGWVLISVEWPDIDRRLVD